MAETDLDDLLLVESPSELSDVQIAYLRDHPAILDLISDRENLRSRHLWQILVAAILLVALSKVLMVKLDSAYDQLLVDVAVDLVFEMGAALIGAVTTVIFLRRGNHKQFIANIRFRAEIESRIAALSERSTSDARPGSSNPPTAGS